MLDQQMPPDRYSPEDRLNALLFHLRARIRADQAALRKHARLLGTPQGAIEALIRGDMHTLYAELDGEGGWPVLASLVAFGGGLDAGLDVLAAVKSEYEVIALGEQRPHLPTTAEELHRRGYRVRRRSRTPVEEVTDPKQVNTFPQLVQALRLLRSSRGDPPYREMAARSVHRLPGWNPELHEPRSHSGMQNAVKEDARPRLAAVLAFVRGCGVTDPQVGRAWEAAHARAAVHEELKHLPRYPPRLRDTVEEWAARTPTGP